MDTQFLDSIRGRHERLKILSSKFASLRKYRFDERRTRLKKQILFERGKIDRLNGEGCLSTHGVYLEGWYYDQFGGVFDYYYMTPTMVNEIEEIVTREAHH